MTLNEWILKNGGCNLFPGKKYDQDEISITIKKTSRGKVSEAIVEKKSLKANI